MRFYVFQAACRSRMYLRLLLIAVVPLVAACEGATTGLSGRDAEWARLNTDGFRVVKASHMGAVIAAAGQQIAIDPAPGFCLARDSIETSKRSAFLLIGDCAVAGPPTDKRGARGELKLPKAVPGIITVSLSGDPGFRSSDGSYEKLTAFLNSPDGRALLGRSGTGAGVEIKESREMDGALLLYLEDSSTKLVPALSNRFWRAFVELNGRLAVVTISGFRDRPLGREKMLAYLISQVQTLGAANAVPLGPPDTRVARADRTVVTSGPRKLSDVRADATGAVKATAETPKAKAPETPLVRDETTDKTAPKSDIRIAEAPAGATDIPRGSSRIERIMIVPRARPGAAPVTPTGGERVATAADPVRTPVAVTTTAPPPTAPPVSAPALAPIAPPDATRTTPTTAPASDVPAEVTGPATKHAPRTAPLAPRRRSG